MMGRGVSEGYARRRAWQDTRKGRGAYVRSLECSSQRHGWGRARTETVLETKAARFTQIIRMLCETYSCARLCNLSRQTGFCDEFMHNALPCVKRQSYSGCNEGVLVKYRLQTCRAKRHHIYSFHILFLYQRATTSWQNPDGMSSCF